MSAPPQAAADVGPLEGPEFSALLERLGPFEEAPSVAVAVSGGCDSAALGLLAAEWAQGRGGLATVLVVDHRSRPESTGAAHDTAAMWRSRGVPAVVLTSDHPMPVTGFEAAAREVRYRLLCAACRARGILHLMVAHHADDQAETITLRRDAGSGPAGLSGMAAVREQDGVRVLRPLLPVGRARLMATARAHGIPWIEDPMNRDLRFARARMRVTHLQSVLQSRDGAPGAAADRERLEIAVATILATHARPHPYGFIRIDAEVLRTLPELVRGALLSRVLTTVGGRVYPPSRRAVDALGDWTEGRRSLAGCLIRHVRGAVEIVREPGRIDARLPLAPGRGVHWDQRWRLSAGNNAPAALHVAKLGSEAARHRRRGVPAIALASLPAVWQAGTLVGCPPLGFSETEDAACVTAVLHASVAASPAPFAAVNVVSLGVELI